MTQTCQRSNPKVQCEKLSFFRTGFLLFRAWLCNIYGFDCMWIRSHQGDPSDFSWDVSEQEVPSGRWVVFLKLSNLFHNDSIKLWNYASTHTLSPWSTQSSEQMQPAINKWLQMSGCSTDGKNLHRLFDLSPSSLITDKTSKDRTVLTMSSSITTICPGQIEFV